MGLRRVALCTGVLAGVALVPAAHAAPVEEQAGVSVAPSAPAPGTDVTLRVADCTEKTALAASDAFVADARLAAADGALVGSTRVRSTAKAGAYRVRVTCGVVERTGTITVAGQAAGPEQPRTAASPLAPPVSPAPATPLAHASAPASPIAPVEAGGGGGAHLATVPAGQARAAGPGTAHTVTGLVLAGIAAVAVALRGVRRSRGTGHGTG
ncbi:hypothetical protein [Streptomyces sp. S.PNR 29]|uniref:hypothetical protein n=1 Tax=Streptomyces sp. S.PNR 29 TaxID=2973805 RepID=UPI0025AF2149|nr:hypothetical protein [Streptomyces sp. S.PNR 29]MDN0197055.1 hypothetical protein [Streptomyces sp. S.PNR 29]